MFYTRVWRVVRALILWLLGLPVLAVVVYAATALRGPFSLFDVTLTESGGNSCPAAPRTKFIPLYTAPHGKQVGRMYWWEYFDRPQAKDDYLPLELSETPTVARHGIQVGNWLRRSDLSFDLRDIARVQAQVPAQLQVCEPLALADWNGDGLLEHLKTAEDDDIFDSWQQLTLYGTPHGQPVTFLDFKSSSITPIHLSDGSTAFTTPGLTWNQLAYRWHNGHYQRLPLPQQRQRANMVADAWRDAWSSIKDAPMILAFMAVPACWLLLFASPWVLGATIPTKKARMSLSITLLALTSLCWATYHYFGYENSALWLLTLVMMTVTTLSMLGITYVRAWHARKAEWQQ